MTLGIHCTLHGHSRSMPKVETYMCLDADRCVFSHHSLVLQLDHVVRSAWCVWYGGGQSGDLDKPPKSCPGRHVVRILLPLRRSASLVLYLQCGPKKQEPPKKTQFHLVISKHNAIPTTQPRIKSAATALTKWSDLSAPRPAYRNAVTQHVPRLRDPKQSPTSIGVKCSDAHDHKAEIEMWRGRNASYESSQQWLTVYTAAVVIRMVSTPRGISLWGDAKSSEICCVREE